MQSRKFKKFFRNEKDWELSANSIELYDEHYKGNLLFDLSYTLYIAQAVTDDKLTEKQKIEMIQLRIDPNFFKTIIQIFSVTYTGKKFEKVMEYVGTDINTALGGLLVISSQFFRRASSTASSRRVK